MAAAAARMPSFWRVLKPAATSQMPKVRSMQNEAASKNTRRVLITPGSYCCPCPPCIIRNISNHSWPPWIKPNQLNGRKARAK